MLNKKLISESTTWEQLFAFLTEAIESRLKAAVTNTDHSFPEIESFIDQALLESLPVADTLSEVDLLALTLAMAPHMQPDLLYDLLSNHIPAGREFPEMGLIKGKNRELLFPTVDTLLYILAGKNLEMRLELTRYFQQESSLFRNEILDTETVPYGEPKTSGKLLVDEEYVDIATTGKVQKPRLGSGFPARLIETNLGWENLILHQRITDQVLEIQSWLQHNDMILHEWGMKGKVKPGYRVLFYGAPGTGKTLTATLLGKYTGRDVYRVDLSLVVSKYIGETEKNLSRLFDKAANKDWILFFDEADAVFGKRTSVKDAHDKYANQEVSYLLQRIEGHPGLVILASNLKSNLDTAFTRRFQSMIEFEMPGTSERMALWKDNLPKGIELDKDVSLEDFSRIYTLSGANIVNVIQYACLKTAEKKHTTIGRKYLLEGIKKEYDKEGKMFS